MADDLIERLKATEGHTRGPWRIRRNRSHNPEECDLTICGDIFLLADVNGPNYSHCEPNADLIALAPEMKARILSDATDLLAARVTVAGRSMTVAELIAAHERAVAMISGTRIPARVKTQRERMSGGTPEEIAKNLTKTQRDEIRYLASRFNRSIGRYEYGRFWDLRVRMEAAGLVVRRGPGRVPFWVATDLGRAVAAILAALPEPPAPTEPEGA